MQGIGFGMVLVPVRLPCLGQQEAWPAAPRSASLFARRQNEQLLDLLKQNTELTETTRVLSERIEQLTREIHAKFIAG